MDASGASQLWLRETVKRWAKRRLGTGTEFGTLCPEGQAISWFSRFLTEQHPEVGVGPSAVTTIRLASQGSCDVAVEIGIAGDVDRPAAWRGPAPVAAR